MIVSKKQDYNRIRTIEQLLQRYDLDAIVGLKQAAENSEVGLTKTNKILEEFMVATLGSIENIQSQIDGNITTWFYSGVPALSNLPASEWTTDELKMEHLGDLYYDQDTGYAYRFVASDDGTYSWLELADNDVEEALALANAAQDTADSKRRVFVEKPTPPYDVGDLWFYNKEIYICQISKSKDGIYEEDDWTIATDYNKSINDVKNDLATNYYTITEVDSAFIVNKDSILSTVSKTYVTSSAYNGLVTKVETVESTATQTAEQFRWLVESGSSASNFILTDKMIEATTERFVIKSSSGKTIISGGVINVDNLFAQDITATGTITGVNLVGATGSFSGKITAFGGKIGAWDIYSNGILASAYLNSATKKWYGIGLDPRKDMFDMTKNGGKGGRIFALGQLGATGAASADAAVNGTWGNAALQVYANGRLETSDIDVRGGKIGDWNLGSRTVYTSNTQAETWYSGACIYAKSIMGDDGEQIDVTLCPKGVHIEERKGTEISINYKTWTKLLAG